MAYDPTSVPPRTSSRNPVKTGDRAEFLKRLRDVYQKDTDADAHNVEPAREDMRFAIGDQWDPQVRRRREAKNKPVLTVNRMTAFIAQYVGSQLQSDTAIKLTPTHGGSRVIADIRQGVIRAITRDRMGKHALNVAMTNAYICGIGNFMVTLQDAKEDVFLRDIVMKPIPDPFAVVWDRASQEPTGEDAQHCFVSEYMTRDDFDKAYPKAKGSSGWYSDMLDETAMTSYGWDTDEMVKVVQFWQMREEPITLGLEAETNDVIDVGGMTEDQRRMALAVGDDGLPMVRETVRRYAECWVVVADKVLEGPYRLDIPRLPVFRVEGWALQEATTRHRWGFVRNAKDPQRLHNYWRSKLAEELTQAVGNKWLIDKAGDRADIADQFRHAHVSDDPVLWWDSAGGGTPPQQIPPRPTNEALLTQSQMTVQDMRDVTNRHEVAMGQRSNEVSGRAITARQRVSEMGDVVFVENMNAALAEAGRVINALIPTIYDTHRTVKIMGDDDEIEAQEINGVMGDQTPDITLGKYALTYSTGPSYATKRQESVDLMMTLMNTMPQTGNVIADIIARNMDIPGAQEIEQRLASLLPPGMLDASRLPASRRAQVEQQQQMQAAQAEQHAQLQQAVVELQMAKLNAEAEELKARGARQAAQAAEAASRIGVDAARVDIDQAKVLLQALTAGIEASRMGLSASVEEDDATMRAMQAAQQLQAMLSQAQQPGAEVEGQEPEPGAEGAETVGPSGEPMAPGLGGLQDNGMPVRPRTAPVEDSLSQLGGS